MSPLSSVLSPPATVNHVPLPSTGRAGRNLPAALGVAVVLIALILASLLYRKELFIGVVVVAVCGALWELAGAFARKRIRLPLAPLWVGTVGMCMSAWLLGAEAALGAYIATAGSCMLWCFMDQAEAEAGTSLEAARHDDIPRTSAHDQARRVRSLAVVASVFAATYLPYLASFAVLVVCQEQGVAKTIMLFALPVASDTGGWLAGITMGRHPMAPSVSPKKSWEGFAGSMVAAMGAGVACLWFLHGPLWAGALVGAAAVVAGTLGDLGESLLKRDLGLKDMGTLLPGHGGLMDRLDSILVTAPVVYVFCLLVL